MTKPTFNQRLRGTTLLRVEGNHFVIGAGNAYSVDWLTNRLQETVLRTLTAIIGHPITVEFVPMEPIPAKVKPTPPIEPEPTTIADDTPVEPFAGFETPESNWTATPDVFFTHVARYEEGIVTKLVSQVIFQTWGQFEDKRRQTRVWEWPVTMSVLHEVCGIKSRTGLYIAIWEARNKGYLMMRQLSDPEEIARFQARYGYKPTFTLRLRQRDDGVDAPTTERPNYGPPAKRDV